MQADDPYECNEFLYLLSIIPYTQARRAASLELVEGILLSPLTVICLEYLRNQ